MINAVVIGSVYSSKIVLEELIQSNIQIKKVYSLDESISKDVSGYYPLHDIAEKNGIPYEKFIKINQEKYIIELENLKPDYIFVIGLSQLVNKRIILAATKGTIGFHPTPLPKYRGRAAMVWQVLLGVKESKCTMFLINDGMDSGDIIGQEPYTIEDTDYASDLEDKTNKALQRLTTRVLKDIENHTLIRQKQNEEKASYLLRRTPEDGRIDWNLPIEQIHRLIRGTSHPYPGAFTYYEGEKIIIWRADKMKNKKYIGTAGQIANLGESYIDVVCTDGLLRIKDYEQNGNRIYKVGHKFESGRNI